MSKNILVVAAHPDDELLGAGATLCKHVAEGDIISCLILGEGMTSREKTGKSALKMLHADSLEAAKILGFKNVFFSNFPDNSFDTVSLLKITKVVEKYIAEIKPDVIYTHHQNDLNIDHRITFEAVLTASRPCNPNCISELYTFETLSSTEWQAKNYNPFSPNTYINIEKFISKKLEALKCYKSEIRNYPHSRSLEGVEILAKYRGLESGLLYAEAFCLIRQISKNG